MDTTVITHLVAYILGGMSMFLLLLIFRRIDNVNFTTTIRSKEDICLDKSLLRDRPLWNSSSTKYTIESSGDTKRDMTEMEKAAFKKAMASIDDDIEQMGQDLENIFKKGK